jgi:hypothetical protein
VEKESESGHEWRCYSFAALTVTDDLVAAKQAGVAARHDGLAEKTNGKNVSWGFNFSETTFALHTPHL